MNTLPPCPLKAGTKVKGIRLVEGDHNIDCKFEGFAGMKLKSDFVRKVRSDDREEGRC